MGTASVNCSHFQSRMKYPSKSRKYSPKQYTNRIQVPDIMRFFGPTNSIAAKCKCVIKLLYSIKTSLPNLLQTDHDHQSHRFNKIYR